MMHVQSIILSYTHLTLDFHASYHHESTGNSHTTNRLESAKSHVTVGYPRIVEPVEKMENSEK